MIKGLAPVGCALHCFQPRMLATAIDSCRSRNGYLFVCHVGSSDWGWRWEYHSCFLSLFNVLVFRFTMLTFSCFWLFLVAGGFHGLCSSTPWCCGGEGDTDMTGSSLRLTCSSRWSLPPPHVVSIAMRNMIQLLDTWGHQLNVSWTHTLPQAGPGDTTRTWTGHTGTTLLSWSLGFSFHPRFCFAQSSSLWVSCLVF